VNLFRLIYWLNGKTYLFHLEIGHWLAVSFTFSPLHPHASHLPNPLYPIGFQLGQSRQVAFRSATTSSLAITGCFLAISFALEIATPPRLRAIEMMVGLWFAGVSTSMRFVTGL
jgi:hypothetical protein